MTSLELIKTFPKDPDLPIYYVMYNSDMKYMAMKLIADYWGQPYATKYVTVTDLESMNLHKLGGPVSLYLDPSIQNLRTNGYN